MWTRAWIFNRNLSRSLVAAEFRLVLWFEPNTGVLRTTTSSPGIGEEFG